MPGRPYCVLLDPFVPSLLKYFVLRVVCKHHSIITIMGFLCCLERFFFSGMLFVLGDHAWLNRGSVAVRSSTLKR